MKISARNRIKGTIREIKQDSILANITLEISGGQTISSVITTSSVSELGLKVGDEVYAIIKSTEVMIGKD
jgi:molybdopterin-binding protein